MPQKETPITLLKGDTVGAETDYRDALPENMIAVLRPILGAQGYMVEFPGLTFFGSSDAGGFGPTRGGLWNERAGLHYRVQGQWFTLVSDVGVMTQLALIPGVDTVSLPYSFNTQAIIAEGRMWLWDITTTSITEIVDPDLGDPIDGVWIDGYYFLTDGEFLYHTDLADETQIDPLKFATAEFSPDPTLGVGKTVDNKAIAFGRYSTEYFSNVANPQFAFTRIPSRALKTGIVGTHAKVEINDQWYILGGRKNEDISVHVIGTGTSTEVSSREVDKLIQAYTEEQLADVVLESFTISDYIYLAIHLPNETLLYNVTLANTVGNEHAWSILKTGVGNDQWRGKFGVFDPRIGAYIYGDKFTTNLARLDESASTQYDEIQEWVLYTPFIDIEKDSIDELRIETIPGFTITDDATVFVSLTYDGVNYGREWTANYGLPSDYGKNLRIRRLGYVADWFGLKLRGASRSRMAFGRVVMRHG